jgi:Na+/H+-dicarboxylate symporter
MVMIVGWVLRVAAVGIFALAFSIGASAGLGALAALGHYILVQVAVALALIALLYVVAVTLGRVPLASFARAMAPAQAVAAGTQSSVASLPAMLASAARIGIAPSDAGVIIPLAVAMFKVSAGSGTIVSSLGAAWMAGVLIAPAQLIAAIPIALLATFTVLGVPGPGSVLAATTPVAMALGAPVELLVVTLAVDTIPDMFRTTANVTADVAVAAIAAPRGKVLD